MSCWVVERSPLKNQDPTQQGFEPRTFWRLVRNSYHWAIGSLVAERCKIDSTILRLEFNPQSATQFHHNLHNPQTRYHTCISTRTCSCNTCTLTQSGQKLHKDLSLEELWEGALEAYGRNDWQSTTDLLEEALKLYTNYENQTFQCLLQCQEEGEVESRDRSNLWGEVGGLGGQVRRQRWRNSEMIIEEYTWIKYTCN